MSSQDAVSPLLRKRLLSDIRELVEKPYPNITLHTHDHDLSHACLVLTPTHYKPLHLTIRFHPLYPLNPPDVFMDSNVKHPNVYGNYICATILRKTDEYTPAYTLKGIAIQLLSFFSSDSVEQEHGGKAKLDSYKAVDEALYDDFRCRSCHFPITREPLARPHGSTIQAYDARIVSDPDGWPAIGADSKPARPTQLDEAEVTPCIQPKDATCHMDRLPNELLLLVLEQLDFEQLTNFAAAWPKISDIIRDFDVVRQRELQCFCLKQDYRTVKLGVGVSQQRGKIASEFDLLSEEAYRDWRIRRSINNLNFQHWLPLPISRPHWGRVKEDARKCLRIIKPSINDRPFGEAQVIFTFMNDVVVRLNQVADGTPNDLNSKSNLRHASEKAIDSYFHLFHLLVCLAIEDQSLVRRANSLLRNFLNGKQSKTDCPNLGHLLIALLISDVEVTEPLMRTIITEAITRNVVWLLDRKGAGMPELSYMEEEPVSAYRLDKTFEGSRTSYRLLMFSELFRRTARPSHKKPLDQVCDELFTRHGAPPHNAAQKLAETVRRLHTINDFPAFLKEMGLQKVPDPKTFTNLLRKTVYSSMEKEYSKWGCSPKYALLLRTRKDPHVSMSAEDAQWVNDNAFLDVYNISSMNFFPNKHTKQGDRNRNDRRRG